MSTIKIGDIIKFKGQPWIVARLQSGAATGPRVDIIRNEWERVRLVRRSHNVGVAGLELITRPQFPAGLEVQYRGRLAAVLVDHRDRIRILTPPRSAHGLNLGPSEVEADRAELVLANLNLFTQESTA